MSEKHWYVKFSFRDYEADLYLRMCSLAAQGLWMRMLCIMHEGTPYGHLAMYGRPLSLQDLSRIVCCHQAEVEVLLAELEAKEIFSRDKNGTIFNRRMQRDREIAKIRKIAGGKGGNPNFIKGTVPKDEREPRGQTALSKTKKNRIFQKSDGLCHWCSVQLDRENFGPNFFHIDHVIALRDGGTSDENNLVASCAACNHDRATVKKDVDLVVNLVDGEVGTYIDSNSKSKNKKESIPKATPSAHSAPDERDARTRLWQDGRPILRDLTGETERTCGSFIGGLVKLAKDDCELVLRVLREAEARRPVDPKAWITAGITRAAPTGSREMANKAEAVARLGGLDGAEKTHKNVPGPTIDGSAERVTQNV